MMTVVRFDTTELRPDRLQTVIEWIRSLSVDPYDVRPVFVILMAESTYKLHLSRFVRDEGGRMVIDQAREDVVTYPVVIDLGSERNWPSFLNDPTLANSGR